MEDTHQGNDLIIGTRYIVEFASCDWCVEGRFTATLVEKQLHGGLMLTWDNGLTFYAERVLAKSADSVE